MTYNGEFTDIIPWGLPVPHSLATGSDPKSNDSGQI